MSTVRLIAFAGFKVHGQPDAQGSRVEVVFGALDARFNAEDKVELLAGSVPFNSDSFAKKVPRDGLLMLYGNRDSVAESALWRAKARELGAEYASVEIEFDIGDLEIGLSDRDLLRNAEGKSKFLNVKRMRKDLQLEILAKFEEYVVEEGGDSDVVMGSIAQIATRPDLFDRLFRDDAELSKLAVLVIPVADDPGNSKKIRQLAYVRPGAKIVQTFQGNTKATIVLPRWMDSLEAMAERDAQRDAEGRSIEMKVRIDDSLKNEAGAVIKNANTPPKTLSPARRRMGPV